ncbi:DUF805 domain-containing protein [Commensalibacter oyaizuii]|uniref:DUF805 domain-containing protein n=1 Tax=Commensalibacter oyaizuii TaxID=3043873 RepID=A0ABT6PYU6_9PROT|nr:DUF805 domain-containing protein [Commensalibacter sp. TBRC 16381]MDI2090027.1 DUF805 domain-containing protein [Commensalibacter sp. TBRC 16381]
MQGKILSFSIQENIGYILGDDGHHYLFKGSEWKASRVPKPGVTVTFDTDHLGKALQISTLSRSAIILEQVEQSDDPAYLVQLEAEKRYNMFDWFLKCLKNYFNFSGRARRSEYWYYRLSKMVFAFLLGLVSAAAFAIMGFSDDDLKLYRNIIALIMAMLFLFPDLAVCVRRLHDVGRSGWWFLIAFTIIGVIPLLIWFCKETDFEINQWGPPSKDFV